MNNKNKTIRQKAKIISIILMIVIVFISLTGIFIWRNNHFSQKSVQPDEYWIAAHYFGDAWPKNMWDSEFENASEDFGRMKEDGFNCIVLCIPWREFQPDIEKPYDFNTAALNKLFYLFEQAKENDMGIILRLGYFWDYYKNRGKDELYSRYYDLVGGETARKAWYAFAQKMYESSAAHDNFLGGFICWEDFWSVIDYVKGIGGNTFASISTASFLGYTDYMKNNYASEELCSQLEIKTLSDIYIPSFDSSFFRTFYDFYDEYLIHLLTETQTFFPGLSMEVRADDDLVMAPDGSAEYYSHRSTYFCEGAEYSAIVYGIPMGFENKGERIDWPTALKMTGNILSKISREAGYKKLFIDQFLFFDNTQKFQHNARIKEDQIADYLLNCPDVLMDFCMGYGIWTYKDYYFDAVANGEFGKGLESWAHDDGVKIEQINGSNKCLLSDGLGIEQDVSGKIETISDNITCTFEATPVNGNSILKIFLNGNLQEIPITRDGEYTISFAEDTWDTLRIESAGTIYIDNIKLYNFRQEGFLYAPNWQEGICISAIRDMNQILAKKIKKQQNEQPYYDLIKNFFAAETEGLAENKDFPWGKTISLINNSENELELFMSPDTCIQYKINLDDVNRTMQIQYGLQETAATWDISDGADITVELYDDLGKMLKKLHGERVQKDGKLSSLKIDLSEYKNRTVIVQIKCTEESGGSYDADWIVLKEAAIE